jgi:hypothetical protein
MSRSQLDLWLDNELPASELPQFESWLRENPDHLKLHFQEVQLQERLRSHFRVPRRKFFPLVTPSPALWITLALCAAASVIIAAYVVSLPVSPSPTSDPFLFVLTGNPRITQEWIDMQPGAAPFPVATLTPQTIVETLDTPSSVRWDDNCFIELEPKTLLTLRPAPKHAEANGDGAVASIQLDQGGVTVRRASIADSVYLYIDGTRILIASPVTLKLSLTNREALEPIAKLTVLSGTVLVSELDLEDRQIAAGETISLPIR